MKQTPGIGFIYGVSTVLGFWIIVELAFHNPLFILPISLIPSIIIMLLIENHEQNKAVE